MLSTKERNILIIGTPGCREPLQEMLKDKLAKLGYYIKIISNIDIALKYLKSEKIPVVFLCEKLADINKNKIINNIKKEHFSTEVIVLGQHSTMRSAFDSMRLGAYDYLIKPFDVDRIILTVEQITTKYYEKSENNHKINRELSNQSIRSDIVGESSAVKTILNLTHKIAPTAATVLIQGETGTGKGLIADAIHKNSLRWNKPFIVVNCSAIPESLLESELFGYEKGAFTDATCLKHGILEAANGGTLFLDEISELSLNLQSKLLQVVETGQFRRLGSNREAQVDLRIISATNVDIYRNVVSNHFRKDLYYRLSVININVPPLRERTEDIPLLSNFFLENIAVSGKRRKTISPEAMETLQSYNWPGNIRELRNVIEQILILTETDITGVRDLPPNIQKHETLKQLLLLPPEEGFLTLEEVEKIYVEKTFQHCRGHRGKTAEILGITRHTLYNKLRQFKINVKKSFLFDLHRKKEPSRFGK